MAPAIRAPHPPHGLALALVGCRACAVLPGVRLHGRVTAYLRSRPGEVFFETSEGASRFVPVGSLVIGARR